MSTNILPARSMLQKSRQVVALALALGWSALAMAHGSSCYELADWDARQRCLADVRRDHAYCHAIRDHDQRQLCLAEIKLQRGYCHSIRDADVRHLCLIRIR